MNPVVACALAGALLVAAGGDDITQAIRKDKAALQGVWKVIASEQDGEKVSADDIKSLYLIFKADRILVREGGRSEEKFSFLLDPAKKPKEIDLTIQFGPNKGKVDRAIYQLDGDKLKICIQSNKEAPRPRDFATQAGSKLWLVEMRRMKE